MIERITEEKFFSKIEASVEWAIKENYGDWVLFVRDEPNGPVSKFLGPDPKTVNLVDWIRFGTRIIAAGWFGISADKWLPENFDIRSELPEGDLE